MENIWKREIKIEELNLGSRESIVGNVGITFVEKGKDFLSATMPVDKRTKQPLGILHGGASVVLAETLGSTASYMTLEDPSYSVGLEIKANHLKNAVRGAVKGMAKPVHLGKTTQVWDITIKNQENELICVSRLTMLVLNPSKDQG